MFVVMYKLVSFAVRSVWTRNFWISMDFYLNNTHMVLVSAFFILFTIFSDLNEFSDYYGK